MAAIERRGKRFRIIFHHQCRRYSKSLKTTNLAEANAIAGNVERTLLLLEQQVLQLPEGSDLVTFVLSGGKQTEQPKAPTIRTFAELRDRYLQAHEIGAMEENSLVTVKMHLQHFAKTIGASFPIHTLQATHVQQHISRRARQKGIRKKPLSPATIKKEVTSIRACWNWAVASGLLTGTFPTNKVLKYPKSDEKPRFSTWEEIEAQVARGGLSKVEIRELWDCLFLTRPEISELLEYVMEKGRHGFIYPMFAFAAHTGARRSEMLRLRISDVDFKARTATLREKKRARGMRTTRQVPLSPFLVTVLADWLRVHPGGQFLFCHDVNVLRSKTKSPDPLPLTKDQVHDQFHRTLAGSKWEILRGWHVFRHSFCSNCAAAGIDQRLIDAWVGHTTEEMRKRYRHLIPNQERQAIEAVFGGGNPSTPAPAAG